MAKTFRDPVKVIVQRPTKSLLAGDFNKVLYITNEVDSPIKRYTSIDEIATDYTTSSLQYKGISKAFSQQDADGNIYATDYFYAGGFVPTAGSTDEVEAFFKAQTDDNYYGLIFNFYDEVIAKWVADYLIQVVKFAIFIAPNKDAVKTELKSTKRIYFLYTGEQTATDFSDKLMNAYALTAHTYWQGPSGRWATRALSGVIPTCTDRTLESELFDNNINVTKNFAGYQAVTNGSWCADGETHADQTIKIDNIVHDITINLEKLLVVEKNLVFEPEGLGKIESLLNRVCVQLGRSGVIARNNAGDFLYKVYVPSWEDTNPDTGITTDDIIDRVLRNVKIDFTITTEIENIDVTLIWHDQAIDTGGAA